MASRVRGSSIKEPSKISYAKDRFHDSEESSKTYKNGTRENRYHFGMQREEEPRKNGRDYKEETKDDPDFLYRRSREYFGTWDFKDIAQDEQGRSRKHEDVRLTNGKSKIESTKQEVLYDEVESPRNHLKIDSEEVDREEASQRSRKRENIENEPRGRSRNEEKKDVQKNERELLLREIESLAVDGKSPDRRIRAMIERFKTREEEKLKVRRDRNSSSPERDEKSKNRRDWNSMSPDREEHRSKGQIDRNSMSPEREERSKGRIEGRRIEDCEDPSDKSRNLKEDDERRAGRSKTRELEKIEHERSPSENRLNDRRSRSREKPEVKEREEDTRRIESFRQKSDVERNHRRRSRENEEDRTRDGSRKRNTYVYDAAPEEFDVRIQRYERALLEPRKDPELSRRVSPRNSDADLGRKESFKDQDRQVSRKSSFKGESRKNKDRDSSLNRRTSFKDHENDSSKKNNSKNQDSGVRYFGNLENEPCRKNSKDIAVEGGRKNSFKEQNTEYGRICFKSREDELKNREGEVERKNSLKGQSGGVSRITFKERNDESGINSYREPETEVERVGFKDRNIDGRKNSFKEKSVEFGGIFYKDDDEDEKRIFHGDNEPNKVSFGDSERKRTSNERYEFGKVSFKTSEERPETRRSPTKEYDRELDRKSSFKERRNRAEDENESNKVSFGMNERARSPNGRYEFGKVPFKSQEERMETRRSPTREHDRGEEQKSSFKDRRNLREVEEHEPSKMSFLVSERTRSPNERYEFGKVSFKNQEDLEPRRSPTKDHNRETERKNSFKERRNFHGEQDIELNRVSFEESPRKRSPNGRYEFGKVSFKTQEEEPRRHPSKDNDREIDRRSSSKDKRNFDQDNDSPKVSFLYEDSERKRSPNGRYEISKVTFQNDEDNFQKDIDSDRRISQKDDEGSKRRSSPRSRTRGIDRSDRHSRPLSPPKRNDPDFREDSRDQEGFCARSWHESNRVFATKYLRDNSKLRRADLEESPPETALVHREFRDSKFEGFPEDEVEDVKRDKDPRAFGSNSRTIDSFTATTHERNGATIIRIRSSPENPGERIERRRRRRPQESSGRRRHEEDERESEDDEEEDDDKEDMENDNRQRSRAHGRAVPTPSRRIWNYREGGVLITDVEEGQPCLQCGETCPGFSPHSWRLYNPNNLTTFKIDTITGTANSTSTMKSKYLLSILVIFYATTYTIAEESQEVQNQAVQNQEDSSTAVSPQSEEDSSVTFDRNVHYNINDISLYKNAFSGQRHRYPPSRPPILRTRTMPTYTPPSTQSWTRPTRRRTRNRVRRTRSTAPVTAESTTPVTVETQTPQREGYQKAYNEEPITPYSPPYQYSPPINLGLPQQSNGNNAGPINVDTANVLDVLLKPRGGGPYGNYGGGYGQGGYGQGGYGQGGYGDGMGGGGMGGGGMGGGGMGGGGMGGGGMGGGGLGGYGQSGYGNDYGPVGNGGGTTPSNYDDLGGYDDQGYDDEGYEDLTASTKNVETPNNKKQPMSNKNSNYDEDEYGTGLYSDTDN